MEDEYKDCILNVPNKFDNYLVKTVEGCYDFAHFANGKWHKGVNTNGKPDMWMEIPRTNKESLEDFIQK